MNHEIFNNRNNSLFDYLNYLQKLVYVKSEQALNGEITMVEYNQLCDIMKDLEEIYNKENQ
jgi:hypothetical protein